MRSLALFCLLSIGISACNKTEAPKPREDEAKKTTPVPSDMVFNDFVPENMKVRDAGALPSGLPTGEVVPDTENEGKTKVVDAGADPKVARKYTFTAGKTAKRTFTIAGSEEAGGRVQAQPAVVVGIDIATKAVKNGNGTLEVKITSIDLADKDKIPPQALAEFTKQMQTTVGIVISFDVDPHGKFGNIQVGSDKKNPKQNAEDAGQLAMAVVPVLYPLLPEDPIGVGAKWEAAAEAGPGGAKAMQTFTLKDWNNDAGTIESKTEAKQPPRQVNDQRVPPGSAVAAETVSNTVYSFRLDAPPSKVKNDVQESTILIVPPEKGGKPQAQIVRAVKRQLTVDTAK